MNGDRKPCRSRMPAGFARFREDLGEIICNARKAMRMKQQTLADLVGITRTRLSAIENERAWPLPNTISALMDELHLKPHQVYVEGHSPKTTRTDLKSTGASERFKLGGKLLDYRKDEGLTLRQLSEACGLSPSQLSRIERGQASFSRAFEDHPDHTDRLKDDRPVRFKLKGLPDL